MQNIDDRAALSEWDMTILNREIITRYRDCLLAECKDGYNKLLEEAFLVKIGACYRQAGGRTVPTVAGVLMFGNVCHIEKLFPNYFLDFQEIDMEGQSSQYRTTSYRGMKCGNIFEFYLYVYEKIKNMDIVKENHVIGAIKQILANALIHADYTGRRGIVIKVRRDAVEIGNPGKALIPKIQLMKGGISDPRNPVIFKMFSEIGAGDRAGMGVPEVLRVWKENKWNKPVFNFEKDPDRVEVYLPFE